MATEEKKDYYFAAYLVIQTSDVSDNQLKFVELLTDYVKNKGGQLYTTIQTGKPQPPGCPPGGCQ